MPPTTLLCAIAQSPTSVTEKNDCDAYKNTKHASGNRDIINYLLGSRYVDVEVTERNDVSRFRPRQFWSKRSVGEGQDGCERRS